MIGNKLFDYEITRKIKAGGMGVVYEARRVWGKRERVAVKFLLEQLRDDDNIRRRFIREAEILEMLTHPRIVRILGLDPDRDAFVMEFVEGKTLAELLRTSPQTIRQPQVAVDMFAQLLDAFDYAHHVVIEIGARQEQGVIHRDIKPSNIIIEPDGRPKILDFGISRISTFESTLTDPKLQMGSVAYMSPEQIVNPAGVDWRSDIYALGVNLWELFAGRPPYPQVTNFEAVIQVQNSIRFEPLPLLTDLHGDSEADELAFLHRVDEVVARATAKDPLQRYQRCRDMRDALLATLVPIQTSGSEPTPDPEVFSKHVVESVPVYTPPIAVEAPKPIVYEEIVPEVAPVLESVTRIQEPEPVSSFVGADSSRVNEQMNSITPDGSFRPVVHPASTDNSGKKSAWLLYAVIVLALLVGGTIWWLQDKPTDNVLETKTSEVAPESESTFESITKADSYYETGTHYFFGRNGKPQDYKLAAESYQKAADLGNSNGQSALGFLYQMGLGVEQSYEKAIKLFQASADQGNPEGQKNLGVIYYNGLGVPQDYARALKLFQASAAQGNAEGEVNLGVMYEQGQVVAKDPKAAFTWYMRAANQNLPLAEYYVGLGFQYGTGTEQSYNKAIQWYKQASLHGSKEAKLALKKMQ